MLKISGLVIPQIAEADFASLEICEGDETTVWDARAGLVDLLASRWGLCQSQWGRRVEISTSCGKLVGSTSSAEDISIDAIGDVVIRGFRPETYEGAYNAYLEGTGWSLEKTEGHWEIEKVKSTLGEFSSLEDYEQARVNDGMGCRYLELEAPEPEKMPA
jgi:hypothetical protein